MPFKSIIYPNTELVVVGFAHTTGYDTAFDGSDEVAKKYLEEIFSRPTILKTDNEKYTYFLPVVWGDEKSRQVADVHRFTTNDWPGNPAYKSIVFRNGVYNQIPECNGCMESYSLIAEIEKLRKKTETLEEFERILKTPALIDVPEIKAFFE